MQTHERVLALRSLNFQNLPSQGSGTPEHQYPERLMRTRMRDQRILPTASYVGPLHDTLHAAILRAAGQSENCYMRL